MKYFTDDEVKCPCCGIVNVDNDLQAKMDLVREYYGKPLHVNSCCRCPKHNADIKGNFNSSHITTDFQPSYAVDFACILSHNRYLLLEAMKRAGFNRFEITNKHIHGDVDPNKPKDILVVAWIK